VIGHIDDVEVAVCIEADFVGEIEGGFGGWTSVAGITLFAGTCDGADGAVWSDSADALSCVLAEPQGSVWTANDPERVVNEGFGGWSSIAGEALLTGACEGLDGPGSSMGQERKGEDECDEGA
jgi:hypothetical protein